MSGVPCVFIINHRHQSLSPRGPIQFPFKLHSRLDFRWSLKSEWGPNRQAQSSSVKKNGESSNIWSIDLPPRIERAKLCRKVHKAIAQKQFCRNNQFVTCINDQWQERWVGWNFNNQAGGSLTQIWDPRLRIKTSAKFFWRFRDLHYHLCWLKICLAQELWEKEIKCWVTEQRLNQLIILGTSPNNIRGKHFPAVHVHVLTWKVNPQKEPEGTYWLQWTQTNLQQSPWLPFVWQVCNQLVWNKWARTFLIFSAMTWVWLPILQESQHKISFAVSMPLPEAAPSCFQKFLWTKIRTNVLGKTKMRLDKSAGARSCGMLRESGQPRPQDQLFALPNSAWTFHGLEPWKPLCFLVNDLRKRWHAKHDARGHQHVQSWGCMLTLVARESPWNQNWKISWGF